MQAGIGKTAGPVEERRADEPAGRLRQAPGVASPHPARLSLQVALDLPHRAFHALDDSAGVVFPGEAPEERNRLGRAEGEVETRQPGTRLSQRLVHAGVAADEYGRQVVLGDHADQGEQLRSLTGPAAGRLAGREVVVLAVDDLAEVVVGAAELSDRDHGATPAPLVHWCGCDGQCRAVRNRRSGRLTGWSSLSA